ncbi:MAG: ferritin [Methanotrichaceae archaeon]|nr:ferritin [Methanotrichaceae archaeon]
MLSEKMTEALNDQANRELYSSYLYLSMSAFFESLKFEGMASWMRVQAAEELVHAMKMYDYMVSAGGRAKMLAVEAPQFSWASPVVVFQNVWNHERVVTGLINNLANLAIQENDEVTKSFLQWYLKEQVEEEESSDNVLNSVKTAGNDHEALKEVDKALGLRRFNFPKGYDIFPYVSRQGITIGSLKK